jgi:hypothetical protein
MKRVIYSAFVLLPMAIATNSYAGGCAAKAQAQCSAASACQWDASSQACADKVEAQPDSAGSGDYGMGDDTTTSGDADAKGGSGDADANEF